MSDDPYTKTYPSPSGAWIVTTCDNEVRMSHWIASAILKDASGATLIDFGAMWSADYVTWTDATHVALGMRHYPGDRSAEVSVDVVARIVVHDGKAMTFEEFTRWLA